MNVNRKDLAAGTIFLGIGLIYGIMAVRDLPMGTAFKMGPGYFPIVLSGLTALIGLAVIAKSFVSRDIGPLGAFPWRAAAALTSAVVFFAVFIRDLGLLPSVFGSMVIAAFANPRLTLQETIVAAVVLSFFCTIIFAYGVGLAIPIFGAWFGG
ncbi:MAG: tripartite tricarboxylate transporter TctB family protein [Alphaproteobacteria bacterium]